MAHAAPRRLSFRSTSTWLAVLAATVFFGLGLRAVLAPATASAFFGVPLDGGDGLAFVQAFGARNIGLSLVALALIALDARAGLVAVFFAAAVIAGLDFVVVSRHAGTFHGAKHLGYVALLAGFGAWFARACGREAR
ncbi:MAG: DUF4267 domain-containing protein [Candidatus Binatia bacterium]